MAKNILLALVISSALFLGCGSSTLSQLNPINPPAVSASSLPVGCDATGTCVGTVNHTWGYCQYSVYQTAQTFVLALEIGISSTPTDPSDSLCYVPMATGGIIKSISGNTNYVPWTANLSSMFLDVRACTNVGCTWPAGQEHIASQKYMVKGAPQSLPLSGSFTNGISTNGFMVVFNDDLNVKPTTISVAFAGTFQ
jgi:hypothetical protein